MQLSEEYLIQKLRSVEGSANDYAEIDLSTGVPLKCAAVLIPLVYFGDEWHLLFTRRTDRVESHKGQVSFPGGACDEGELSPEETALREAEEEIGIARQHVKILGRLSRLITITSYQVTPIVGIIPWPYAFKVANFEVARVFTMPLSWLANRANFWELFQRDTERSIIFYHPYDGELLWGATARMTVSFLRTIEVLD